MRATMLAALGCLLFAPVEGGQYQSELKVSRGWKDLVGTWKAVAREGPDGKKECESSEWMTVKTDPATGHLALLVYRADSWLKLEIDPERRPSLYWVHYEVMLPPL